VTGFVGEALMQMYRAQGYEPTTMPTLPWLSLAKFAAMCGAQLDRTFIHALQAFPFVQINRQEVGRPLVRLGMEKN
jgi:hypothetical protein